ncbi:MAG: Uma2 family endonuclease [Chloroflexota bacterium]|nr:Uma2 family endonuclease [Chloroflexota bacterium]
MAIQTERTMTVAEYLAWEARQEVKHDYIDGEIIEMTGGTGKHSKIMVNISAGLYNQIDYSNCVVHSSEMRVRIRNTRYVYPDLSALCGEEVYEDESELTLLNPMFVVEVTSPTSLMRDRVDKLDLYFAVPSIEAYLIVEQDRPRADLYTRSEDGWRLRVFNRKDDVIPLPMLECELPLAQVYRGIEFADE